MWGGTAYMECLTHALKTAMQRQEQHAEPDAHIREYVETHACTCTLTHTEGRSILASPSATLNQRSEKASRSSTLHGLCASLLRAFLHARNLH